MRAPPRSELKAALVKLAAMAAAQRLAALEAKSRTTRLECRGNAGISKTYDEEGASGAPRDTWFLHVCQIQSHALLWRPLS